MILLPVCSGLVSVLGASFFLSPSLIRLLGGFKCPSMTDRAFSDNIIASDSTSIPAAERIFLSCPIGSSVNLARSEMVVLSFCVVNACLRWYR